MATPTFRPLKVTGGCLCASVRYEISFEDENAWPPMIASCQCSMCRKWTGALVSTDLVIKQSQATPSLLTLPTVIHYESSPGTKRGFCPKCGSGIAWFSDEMPEEMIIFVGTIDEEWLMGEVIGDSVKETESGSEFNRACGYAKVLCKPNAGNLFWQNAIEGITDNLSGPKFLQHYVGKAPLPDGK